jgi:hypothetical protein
MDIHVCKQCGLRFAYCRACVFKPIYYKDLGFCSKECFTTFHAPKIEIPEVVEITTEIEPIEEEIFEISVSAEVEDDGIHE